jgi:hypothetical protein
LLAPMNMPFLRYQTWPLRISELSSAVNESSDVKNRVK